MVDENIKVPALEKLIDHCASGIGAVAGPMLAKWSAQKNADARRITAKGDADVIRLISDAQNEARKKFSGSPSSTQGELEVGAQIHTRIAFQEEKRQTNIKSVVGMAAEEIKDKEVQDHEIDHDWTARFFSDVQDVSSEQMQQIWAKILAGQVGTPGQTSLRTLTVLKNMTQKDAELFSNATQFVICEFIFKDNAANNIDGFPDYGTFLQLESYGLVHAGDSVVNKFSGGHLIADRFRSYRISKIDLHADDCQINIPCYILTPAGKELYQLVEVQPNMGYVSVLANFLKGKNAKLEYATTPGSGVIAKDAWIQVQPHVPSEQETKP